MKKILDTNQSVNVYLTDTGIEMYYRYYKRYPKLEKDGSISMQLWKLMQVFGVEYNDIGMVSPFVGCKIHYKKQN